MKKQRANKYLYLVIAVICGVCSLVSLGAFDLFMQNGLGKMDPGTAEIVRSNILNRRSQMIVVVLFCFLQPFFLPG